MVGQTVYTTFDVLDEVFLFKEEDENYRIIYDIIDEYSNVMLDMDRSEFDQKILDHPWLKRLCKRESTMDCASLNKNQFPNINEVLENKFSRDIFIRDQSSDQSLSFEQGVLVINNNDLSAIQQITNRYHRIYSKGMDGGWKSFFSKIEISPINSLILIDSYILQNRNRKSGIANIRDIISEVFKKKCKTDFHFLLVVSHESVFRSKKNGLQVIYDEICNELENVGNVKFGIVTYHDKEKFHNRYAILNYHVIKSPYGFDCFDSDGKVKKSTEPELLGAYHSLKNNEGDPEIRLIVEKLAQVQKEVEKNVKSKNKSSHQTIVR